MTARLTFFFMAACVFGATSGCSGDEPDPTDIVVDSLHVDLLIDLHLARARAEVTGEPPDSLQNEVLATHGQDSLALSDLQESYANQPAAAVALYDRVTEQLSEERRGRKD